MPHYSQEDKTKALGLAAQIGMKKASEELHISYATIAKWKKNTTVNAQEETLAVDEPKQTVNSRDQQCPMAANIPLDEQVRTLARENMELNKENQRLRNAITELISK